MAEEKANQKETVRIPKERLRAVLPNGMDARKTEEYIVKARPDFWSYWCGHDDVVTEIDTFLFCPSLGVIYYYPAGSIFDRSVETHVAITNELIDNIIWMKTYSE